MNDSSILHKIVSINDLVHDLNCIFLGQAFSAGDVFGEVSTIAELSDDIGVVLCVIDVINFKNIFAVFKIFEHLYFRSKKVSMYLVVDFFHIDHFDRHCFIFMTTKVLVKSFLPLKT